MTETEADLLELLKERSFRSEGGPFKLASGEMSSYYIDGKMTVVSSAGVHLIGEVLYGALRTSTSTRSADWKWGPFHSSRPPSELITGTTRRWRGFGSEIMSKATERRS